MGLKQSLAIGFACMLILALLRNNRYRFRLLKIVLLTALMVFFGVIGTMIMFYIENGRWGGTSFYGAVFMIPISFYLLSKVGLDEYGVITDYCAIPICIMLAVMKFRCIFQGCCGGRVLFENAIGKKVVFPSQIMECITIIMVMILLIYCEGKGTYKNKIYPLFLVLYGSTRFILNSFRTGLHPLLVILPAGHFWSIVAIAVGYYLLKRRDTNRPK